MNCESIQELLSAYADDELSANERDLIECHVDTCTDCRDTLSELQKMSSLFRTSFESIFAPIGLEDRIIQTIEASHQGIQARRLSVLYLVFALLGGGVIASLVLSPFGMFITAIIRLMVAVLRGIIHLSIFMGHLWIAALAIFCILLAGSSLMGLFRLLHSTNEAIL